MKNIEELVNLVLKTLELDPNGEGLKLAKYGTNPAILINNYELIKLILEEGTKTNIAKKLGKAQTSISNGLKKKEYLDPSSRIHVRTQILDLINYKWCSSCTTAKEFITSFWSSNTTCNTCSSNRVKEWNLDNIEYKKSRDREYAKNNLGAKSAIENKRRAAKLKRTPPWADIAKIKEFYINRPEGYHVDHIIPLQGKLVSGLHTLENLQYLPAEENLRKKNSFEVI